MKGLLLKDFLTFRKTNGAKVLVPLVLFIVAWSWWQQTAVYASTMFGLVVMTQVLSSFTYDEQAHWPVYAYTLPVKRSTIALEKYLFTTINAGACLVFASLCTAAQQLLFGGNLYQNIVMGGFSALAVLTSLLLCIPLFFRFGVEKTRLATVAGFALPYGVIIGALALYGPNALENAVAPLLMLGYAILLLPAGVASYQISKRIVETQEP